jgi:4-alpha-glucanotransferase
MAWRGLPNVDCLSVTRFLADTPSRLLMVSLEDALGVVEQVNVPGTVDEHPNWQRRLSVPLEDLLQASTLRAVATVMETSGRDSKGQARRP